MEINHKLIFYILYIFINKTHCTNSESYFSKNTTKFKTSSLSLIDDTRQDTIQSFKILWRNLTESNDILQKPISDLELLQEFKKIIENIAKAEESLSYLENNLFWNWSYALVDTEINRIKTYYETISKLIKKQRSQMGWTDLAETYLQSSDNGIKKILEKIHRYVIGFTDKSDTIFDIPIKVTVLKAKLIRNWDEIPGETNNVNLRKLKESIRFDRFTYINRHTTPS